MGSRAIRKLKIYLFSVDTLAGVIAFAVAASVLSSSKIYSDSIPRAVSHLGCILAGGMLALMLGILSKVSATTTGKFEKWLDAEADSAYEDFLDIIETTTAWAGFAFVASVGLALWAEIVLLSKEPISGVPASVVSLYIGLFFYVIVAVVQCLIAAFGYAKRKRRFEKLDLEDR